MFERELKARARLELVKHLDGVDVGAETKELREHTVLRGCR